MSNIATASTDTELSSCCKATVTYGDGGLYCKSCYGEVDWGY